MPKLHFTLVLWDGQSNELDGESTPGWYVVTRSQEIEDKVKLTPREAEILVRSIDNDLHPERPAGVKGPTENWVREKNRSVLKPLLQAEEDRLTEYIAEQQSKIQAQQAVVADLGDLPD